MTNSTAQFELWFSHLWHGVTHKVGAYPDVDTAKYNAGIGTAFTKWSETEYGWYGNASELGFIYYVVDTSKPNQLKLKEQPDFRKQLSYAERFMNWVNSGWK